MRSRHLAYEMISCYWTISLILLAGLGCRPALRRPVTPIPPVPVAAPHPSLESHLLGTWELLARGVTRQMIFEAGGRVLFRGGLESYNPATWRLNEAAQELTFSFPEAPDAKLDVFHMYVGQAVKSFDRPNKAVTYHFDANTWSLNIAGWTYSKPEAAPTPAMQEPVFR
jgi:hypothetical protein